MEQISKTDTIILDFIECARVAGIAVSYARKGAYRVYLRNVHVEVEIHSRARFFHRPGKTARKLTEAQAYAKLGLCRG